jgi:hypothetical protein
MTIDRRLLATALAALPLAACTPNDINLGGAAKHNYALQIENPEPVYADAATTSGSVVVGANERYRTDKVKKPKGQRSNSGSGGGSGS